MNFEGRLMNHSGTPPLRIEKSEFEQRVSACRAMLAEQGLDAVIVNAGASLHYFAGIPWTPTERLVALVIPASGRPRMVCPHFEIGSLRDCIMIDVDLLTCEEDVPPCNVALDAFLAGAKVGLDPEFSFRFVSGFIDARPDLRFGSAESVIDPMRAQKSSSEISLIQHAMSLTLRVHEAVFHALKPGLTASAICRMIDEQHVAFGAPQGSYFCAVQFGAATAFPHGLAGDQILERDSLVLIDTGCRIAGYHSDITRTYAFGSIPDLQAEIWAIEKEAQLAAFSAAEPGAPCHAVDDAARAVLEAHGLGPDYALPGLPHRTGHGVGLAIHEAPYLVRGNKTPLRAGHCGSIEPMIVFPNAFGIRLEDHFYMTEQGPEWFTRPAHDVRHPFG